MNITNLLTSIVYLHCIVKKRFGRQYQSQPSKLTIEYKATGNTSGFDTLPLKKIYRRLNYEGHT